MGENLDNLKSKALETAQRYVDYGSYGATETKAISALKRKCPGYNKDIYTEWFEKAVATHKNAVAFVHRNRKKAHDLYDANKNKENIGLKPLAIEYSKIDKNFNIEMLLNTICFIFYWYHLR